MVGRFNAGHLMLQHHHNAFRAGSGAGTTQSATRRGQDAHPGHQALAGLLGGRHQLRDQRVVEALVVNQVPHVQHALRTGNQRRHRSVPL